MTTLIVLGRRPEWHCPESRQRHQPDSGCSSTSERRLHPATPGSDPIAGPSSLGIALATNKGRTTPPSGPPFSSRPPRRDAQRPSSSPRGTRSSCPPSGDGETDGPTGRRTDVDPREGGGALVRIPKSRDRLATRSSRGTSPNTPSTSRLSRSCLRSAPQNAERRPAGAPPPAGRRQSPSLSAASAGRYPQLAP